MKQKRDIYQEITDKVIAGLENAGQWLKPWANMAGDFPHNATTGREYNGINVLILAMAGSQYPTQQWLTYNQAKNIGGNVRKGEHGEQIVFWKRIEKENEETGEKKSFFMLKTFTVFNVAQCENLDEKKLTKFVPPVRPEGGVIEIAERMGINVQYGGNQAFFAPGPDLIQMPSVEAFKDQHNHEATLLHEMVHWTGSKKRLDRIAHHSYAEEELVAELGAAMAGAMLGFPYEELQHTQYIASWLEALKGDKKYIFKAAKMAQKAVDFILEHVEEHQLTEAA